MVQFNIYCFMISYSRNGALISGKYIKKIIFASGKGYHLDEASITKDIKY